MNLLHIDSSVLADNSVSRKLTAQIVAEWSANHPGTTVNYLDLATQAPSHLSADSLGFRLAPGAAVSDVQKAENAISEALVLQLLAADVIVVGAPLYNFSVPSQLKAWIDRVAQVGKVVEMLMADPNLIICHKLQHLIWTETLQKEIQKYMVLLLTKPLQQPLSLPILPYIIKQPKKLLMAQLPMKKASFH